MSTVIIILMIVSIACFALDAFVVRTETRVNLTALGLCTWALATLLGVL